LGEPAWKDFDRPAGAKAIHRQDFDLKLTQYDARGWSTQLGDKP
jgi:hypothetical protein